MFVARVHTAFMNDNVFSINLINLTLQPMINKGYRILLQELDGSWINWIPNLNFVTLASTIFLIHTTNLKTFLLNGKKDTSSLHQLVLDHHREFYFQIGT